MAARWSISALVSFLLVACAGDRSFNASPLEPTTGQAAIRNSAATHALPPATFGIVYSFGRRSDGAYPAANLLNVSGVLYGTTTCGGVYDKGACVQQTGAGGTVFRIQPDGKNEHILHSFGGGSDGSQPWAGFLDVNGTLYGTTQFGGTYGQGTVFSVSPNGTEIVLHSFGNNQDGAQPVASLINVKGTLYGTTLFGGKYASGQSIGGTVFSITTSGSERIVHSFGNGTDGSLAAAALIEVKGKLYGTTLYGGTNDHNNGCCGVVFTVTPSGKETVLWNFGPAGVQNATWDPAAPLVNVNGTLYGTTEGGGYCSNEYCFGSVFSVTADGNEATLHEFGMGNDGRTPYSGLTNVKGTLYGTTPLGGSGSKCCGTVYSITVSGKETVVHPFTGGIGGTNPYAGLLDVGGSLYGTTYAGGTEKQKIGGEGTIFSLKP